MGSGRISGNHGPRTKDQCGLNIGTLDELEKVKATLPVGKWNAQWMQRPTSEEGALIKREWWRKWEEDSPPDLHYVIQILRYRFYEKRNG